MTLPLPVRSASFSGSELIQVPPPSKSGAIGPLGRGAGAGLLAAGWLAPATLCPPSLWGGLTLPVAGAEAEDRARTAVATKTTTLGTSTARAETNAARLGMAPS